MLGIIRLDICNATTHAHGSIHSRIRLMEVCQVSLAIQSDWDLFLH